MISGSLEAAATEAPTRLTELLRTVERGETIVITHDGKPIAHLVATETQEQAGRRAAMERFLELRSKMGPLAISLEELFAGRREGLR